MSISRRFIKPVCAAALTLFLLAPNAANAVTTPAQYCATVSGYELLNVTGIEIGLAGFAGLNLHCCVNGVYVVKTRSDSTLAVSYTSASCQ